MMVLTRNTLDSSPYSSSGPSHNPTEANRSSTWARVYDRHQGKNMLQPNFGTIILVRIQNCEIPDPIKAISRAIATSDPFGFPWARLQANDLQEERVLVGIEEQIEVGSHFVRWLHSPTNKIEMLSLLAHFAKPCRSNLRRRSHQWLGIHLQSGSHGWNWWCHTRPGPQSIDSHSCESIVVLVMHVEGNLLLERNRAQGSGSP